MITAEEFSRKYTRLRSAMAISDISEMMIEFAKLHVAAALKEASEKATAFSKTSVYGGESIRKRATVSTASILNAYPLENIK